MYLCASEGLNPTWSSRIEYVKKRGSEIIYRVDNLARSPRAQQSSNTKTINAHHTYQKTDHTLDTQHLENTEAQERTDWWREF